MKIKHFNLLIIILVLSCEKQETAYHFPTSLISMENKIISETKLYTREGQIEDSELINEYVLKNDLRGFFNSKSGTIIQINQHDTIAYQNEDTVIFYNDKLINPLTPIIKRIPKNEGGDIFFYLTDTLILGGQQSEISDIIQQIGIYKPYIEFISLPVYHGAGTILRYFDAKIAQGNPYKLEFPNLTISLKLFRDNTYSSILIKEYNNIFDENVIKMLEFGDTLAIQETKKTYLKTD